MKKLLAISLLLTLAALLSAGCQQNAQASNPEAAPEGTPVAVAAPEADAPAAVEANAPADADTVLAIVNGRQITEGTVQRQLELFKTQMLKGGISADQLDAVLPRVRSRIISELIDREILLDAAERENVTISQEEYDAMIDEIKAELPRDASFEDFLRETGITDAEVREQMRIRKLLLAQAEAAGTPTDEEVRAFYDEHIDAMKTEESVTASHILIQRALGDDEDALAVKRAKAEDLREQLLASTDLEADFAKLARENSDCPSKTDGGNLGTFGRGQMVAPFEDACFAQEIGKVGDVVETSFGYHLILVREREDARTLAFDEVKDRIAMMLEAERQESAVQSYVEDLQNKAVVERFDTPPADEEEDADALSIEGAIPEEEDAVEEVAAAEALDAEATPAEVVSDPVAVVVPEPVVETVEAAPAVEEQAASSAPVAEAPAATPAPVEETVEAVAAEATAAAADIAPAIEDTAVEAEAQVEAAVDGLNAVADEVQAAAADVVEDTQEAVAEASTEVADKADAIADEAADTIAAAAQELPAAE